MATLHPGAVLHPHPSRASRVLRRSVRWTVRPLLARVPIGERSFARMRRVERAKPRRRENGLRAVATTVVDLDGVRAEVMVPTASRPHDSAAVRIVYFHGGGFFSGSVASHRSLTELLAVESGVPVVSVDYRLLPEAGVADAVQDALTAYARVCAEVAGGSDDATVGRVVVAGDSAGGYLALKIAELAVERGLPAPLGVVGFSPLVTLEPDRVDPDRPPAVPVDDPYLPGGRVGELRSFWLSAGPVPGAESLLDAEAVGRIDCPVHLVAVEDELLRPQIESFALLLSERGAADVDLHVWRGQVHAFASFVDLLPDARESVRIAAGFVRRRC